MASLTYSSALIFLAVAFVLMYKTIRVPNFALGTMMTFGAFTAYIGTKLLQLPPLLVYPVSFFTGMFLMFIISITVIEPLIRRNRTSVEIALATIGLGILLEGLAQIGDKWIQNVTHRVYSAIMLVEYNYRIGEIRSAFIVSTLLAFALFVFITRFKDTGFGLRIMAEWENEKLAQIQGINTVRDRVVIWVLAGGLAGLAGGISVMWFHITSLSGSWIMMSVFAAALIGGFDSIRGAVIGGLVEGLAEILGTSWGQGIIGVWVGEWRSMIPTIVIVVMLSFAPNGLFGNDIKEEKRLLAVWERLNKGLVLAVILIAVIGGSLYIHTCDVNKAAAKRDVIASFSGYGLEMKPMNKSVTRFDIGNLTSFRGVLENLNINKVYVDTSGSEVTFYYIRNDKYWTSTVRLKYRWLCQYEAQ